MAPPNPKLSFTTCGRNDGYHGNFLWRLETTLNFIGREAAAIGRSEDLEFVIVDWGSEVPLHSALKLSGDALKISRFVIVPPEITGRHNRDGKFAGSLAINAGVRRCRGTYIAQTGGDVLYDRAFLRHLADLAFEPSAKEFPARKTLFLLSCRNVPEHFVNGSPGLDEIGDYLGLEGKSLKVQPLLPFLKGGAAAFLMHRDLWEETRGLDEDWFGWGWTDCDLKLRVCMRYGTVDYGIREGLYAYHLDHPSSWVPHEWRFNPFLVNGEDWGLAGHPFEEFPPAKPVDVPRSVPAGPVPENRHYRLRHFLNLVKFFPSCRNAKSFLFGYFVLNMMILSLPEGNPIRRSYVRLKRMKDSLSGG